MRMDENPEAKPRRSALAVVSAVLGLVALALATAVLLVLDEKTVNAVPFLCYVAMIAVVATGFGWLCIPYIFLSGALAVASVVCAIAGLRRISSSEGGLTGARFAWIGIIASCLAGMILRHVGIPHF